MADPVVDETQEAIRKKLDELKQYIPFIHSVIDAKKSKPSFEALIKKLHELLAVINSVNQLPKMSLALRCEDIIIKLQAQYTDQRKKEIRQEKAQKAAAATVASPTTSKTIETSTITVCSSPEVASVKSVASTMSAASTTTTTSNTNRSTSRDRPPPPTRHESRSSDSDRGDRRSARSSSRSRDRRRKSKDRRRSRSRRSSSDDSDYRERRRSRDRRHSRHRSGRSRRHRSSSRERNRKSHRSSRQKSSSKRRDSSSSSSSETDKDTPLSPTRSESPDIIIEKEKIVGPPPSIEIPECPRSPSPPPASSNFLGVEDKMNPKLIPLEPQITSILSLPMPPAGEDEIQVEKIYSRPVDPRPNLSVSVLKSRFALQQFGLKLERAEKAQRQKEAAAKAAKNSDNPVIIEEFPPLKGYVAPVTIDYDHGRPLSSNSTPRYEEAYSPIHEDIVLNNHDEDDDLGDELLADAEEAYVPPPNIPNFEPPPKPTTGILSTDDLANLLKTNLPMTSSTITRPPQSKPKPPEVRNVPKVNDFIPARGTIGRVPSHLMAGRGKTSETSTSVIKPSLSKSRDPRTQIIPPPSSNIPSSSNIPIINATNLEPMHSPPSTPSLLLPQSAPGAARPVWGVSHMKQPLPTQQSRGPLLQQPPRPLPGLPPIVTPDGQPLSVPHQGTPIPVIGGGGYNRFGPMQQHGPPFHGQMGPGGPMGGPLQMGLNQHGGYNNFQHQQMQNMPPRTYAEHRAAKRAFEEQERRKKAEEDRKAKEAEKRALNAKNLAKSAPQKAQPPSSIRPPTKTPLTKFIDAQPFFDPSKKKGQVINKGKVDEKSKVEEKSKSETKSKYDDKSRPSTSKSQPSSSYSKGSDRRTERRTSSDSRGSEKIHERRSSSEKRSDKKSPERRSSSEHRSVTDEKHVDKSLEKISPLGSLYGEMPGPKVGVGYGVQHFKIPRKPKPPKPRTPTPPPREETPEPMEEEPEAEEQGDDFFAPNHQSDHEEPEEEEMEVTPWEPAPDEPPREPTPEPPRKPTPEPPRQPTPEPPPAVVVPPVITPPPVVTQNPPQQLIEQLTQQQIEAFIKKSFESGEAKKLLDSTKIIDMLKKMTDTKKLDKIKKIIDSDESEESESDEEEEEVVVKEKVKTPPAKKRISKPKPVIESETDTSDDEPLAQKFKPKANNVIKSDTEEEPESPVKVTPEKVVEKVPEIVEPEEKEEEKKVEAEVVVPKRKQHKKMNELDRLHNDIREMFICEGVLNATGLRNTKPVNYASSPDISCARAGRPSKRESLESNKSDEHNKKEKERKSLEKEIKEITPARVVTPEQLPPVYVRLEKRDLTSLMTGNVTEDDNSLDRSDTPCSDRGSRSSLRNVARRGRTSFGPRMGTRGTSNQVNEDQDTTSEDHEESETAEAASMEAEETQAAPEGEVEAPTETPTEAPIRAKTPAPGRGGRGKRGGKRGRKTKWQQGNAKPKKTAPVKAKTFIPKEYQDVYDPHYCFNSEAQSTNCIFCSFNGKKIVDHYLVYHPEEEVLISRLTSEEMKHALAQPPHVPPQLMVLSCRFCPKEMLEIGELYDHVSEHTGEYRYKCPVCDLLKFNKTSVMRHIKQVHSESNAETIILAESPEFDSTFLTGYMCGFCRFVQMNKGNVEKHIEKRHRKELGATIPPNLEEINVINLAKWAQDDLPLTEDLEESLRDNLVVPKSEVDLDGQELTNTRTLPADLPTLNFGNAGVVDPLNTQIKVELLESQAHESTSSSFDNNTLSGMDIQDTLSSLEELLHEPPNNPKSLLETIRSSRYEQEPTTTDKEKSTDNIPSTSKKDLTPLNKDKQIPSTSTTADKDLNTNIEEETSSSDDDNDGRLTIDPKQPNLLKPDLIDKLKSALNSTSEKNEGTQNVPQASTTSMPPLQKTYSRKRKLSDSCACYACEKKEINMKSLIIHIENSHGTDTQGACPMCLFPIGCRNKAVEHLVHCHTSVAERPAMVRRLNEEEEEASRPPVIRIIPLNQLMAPNQETAPNQTGPQQDPNLVLPNQLRPTFPTPMDQSTGGMSKTAESSYPPLGTIQTPPNLVVKKVIPPNSNVRAPPLKMAAAPLHAKTVKTPAVYQSMLTQGKLRHMYKCMDNNCAFTTDNKNKYIRHFNKHEKNLKENPTANIENDAEKGEEERKFGWRQCVYCSCSVVNPQQMLSHVAAAHGNCVFQCAHCFYRSASRSNVLLHQTQSHPTLKPQILMCSEKEPSMEATLPDQTKLLGNLVMPYICRQGSCNRKFFNRDTFLQHMGVEHGPCPLFKCHVCDTGYIRPQILLDHYKLHSYHEYQCMICRHGTDTQEDMHRHLYVEHANYTACLLVRSMIGAKSSKNVLQGALRRLEMSNITVVNVPRDPEDEIDSDVEDPTPPLFPPTLHIPSPAGSDTSPPPSPSDFNPQTETVPQKRTVETPDTSSQSSSGSFSFPSCSSSSEGDSVDSSDKTSSVPSSPAVTVAKNVVEEPKVADEEQDDGVATRSRKQAPPPPPAPTPPEEPQDFEDLDGHQLYLCSNKGCRTSYACAEELAEHLMVCDLTRASSALCCVHCARTFRQVSGLIDHLRNVHGPKRFTCGMCDDYRTSNLANVYRHFRQKHKTVSTTLKPLDPFKNNQETDKFIVLPKVTTPSPTKVGKRMSLATKLNVYSPNEIEQLPKQPIFQTSVQCSECDFTDRVRTNMIRHLKSHVENSKEVTKAIPINPMPCLESKERHFDKMTNWAGSSHRNPDGTPKPQPRRRSGLDLSEGEKEKLPRFIPPSKRYVCGANACTYLTTDINMLKLHVMNLHADETDYACPHCSDQTWITSITGPYLEKALAHLRMHGDTLYRCSVCQFHHSLKRVVEKHLSEKHDEFPESVLIIREPDLPQVETCNDVSNSTGNYFWLCSECGQNSGTNDEIRIHCKAQHGVKTQYRCSICMFRSAGIPDMDKHFLTRHSGENILFYASFYRSDFCDNKIITGVPTVETREPAKPLPTPVIAPSNSNLNQISLDKIRHIRQILVEEVEQTTTPAPKSSPTKMSPPKVPPAPKVGAAKDERRAEKRRLSRETSEDSSLITQFGEFGKPQGSEYCCPICLRYKNKLKNSLREHLYREFQYKKYKCAECQVSAVDKCNLMKHLQRVHLVTNNWQASIVTNTDNPQLEAWANRVIAVQTPLLAPDVPDSVLVEVEEDPLTSDVSSLEADPEPRAKRFVVHTPPKQRSPPKSPSKSLVTRSVLKPRPVENTAEPKEPEKDPLAVEEAKDKDDDDEEHPLVIVEEPEEGRPEEEEKAEAEEGGELVQTSSSLLKDTFNQDHPRNRMGKRAGGQFECKHCKEKFKQTRGLKMHIKLYHFRLGSYLCGHCQMSTNSEQITLQHCRSAHPALPELAIKNPDTDKIILDDDFWEREYGIVKGSNGLTMKQDAVDAMAMEVSSPPDTPSTVNNNKKCQYCDYTTNMNGKLKRHEQRHWVQKPFRCGKCDFEGLREYDIKKHSSRLHPNETPIIIEKPMPNKPDIKPIKRSRFEVTDNKDKESTTETEMSEDGDNDVQMIDDLSTDNMSVDSQPGDEESAIITGEHSTLFRCFYCPLRAVKLPDVHQHWAAVHKNSLIAKTGSLPFRYKSIPMSEFLKGKDTGSGRTQRFCCAFCAYQGTMHSLKAHFALNHPSKPFKIVSSKRSTYKCKHCDFKVFSIPTLKRHHESDHIGEDFGYVITDKPKIQRYPPQRTHPLLTPSSNKYLCLWCQETCETEDKMELHNNCFHSHLEPRFELISTSSTPVVTPSITKPTTTVNDDNDHMFPPTLPVNPPQSQVQQNRRLYLCPECPEKTKTIRGMEEHVRQKHVTEFQCSECNYILQDNKAASMHMYVEHPNINLKLNPIPKSEKRVAHFMKYIKREGDEIDNNPQIPEFSEISIKDILNPKAVKKNRVVAKKSTTKNPPPRNTARKSFTKAHWSPPQHVSDSESSSEYDSEDEDGISVYVPPSQRTPQTPLSQMGNIRSKMPFGKSSIPMTVDKLSQILNLDATIQVKDYYR